MTWYPARFTLTGVSRFRSLYAFQYAKRASPSALVPNEAARACSSSCLSQPFGFSTTSNIGAKGLSPILTTRNRTAKNENPSRSEEHTSELQSLMRISYAVFCLKKKKKTNIYKTKTK